VIEYLQEEIRVLKELLGKKPRFNNGQRRRLAFKGKRLGHTAQDRFSSLVKPNILLAWFRRLVARKYDGSIVRKAGRPTTACEIKELILKLARPVEGNINRRKRLGGLLNYYYREAAG
jgi:hypothetical protein